MKLKHFLMLIPLLFLVSGCTITMTSWPNDPFEEGDPPFARLLTNLKLCAPKANGMPFSYQSFNPTDKVLFDFNGGPDQYGQPTGLSDPIRWSITEVLFEIGGIASTVFWPSDTFAIPHMDNSPIVFIGWGAPIENISGLPFPLKPLSGYPWNSCLKIHKHLYDGPGEVGVLSATASAETLKVDLVCPIMPVDGSYTVDEWGATPTEGVDFKDVQERVIGKSIIYYVTGPGIYIVRWEATGVGVDPEEWEFNIPASWFHKTGKWNMNVGPAGVC